MKYIDLHCDTLTVCADKGKNLLNCDLQTDLLKLQKGGCFAQCFAIFTDGNGAREKFKSYLEFYKNALAENFQFIKPVLSTADFGEKLGSILTVENLGFIGEDISYIDRLAKEGVKMASLVWNNENALACPNLIFENGLPLFEKREMRGLTKLGKEAVERLDSNKIIIDISHLSDGGALEILDGRKIPVVASHSNAAEVCNVSRNLTDYLIKKIADCGGVVGVNFCHDFLGDEAFESVYKHLQHLIKVGGEDIIALGSDFDGIPECEGLEECTKMSNLFVFLEGKGFSRSVLEKLAYKNFLRVFKEVNTLLASPLLGGGSA